MSWVVKIILKKEEKQLLLLLPGTVTVTITVYYKVLFRYDPRFNTWMKIASMNERRAGFHVSAVAAYNR